MAEPVPLGNDAWDDAVLVRAWDDAHRRYKAMHGDRDWRTHADEGEGEGVDEGKVEAEAGDEGGDVEEGEVKEHASERESRGEKRALDSDASDGTPAKRARVGDATPPPATADPVTVAPLPAPRHASPALEALLHAYYYAGYYAGYYDAYGDGAGTHAWNQPWTHAERHVERHVDADET